MKTWMATAAGAALLIGLLCGCGTQSGAAAEAQPEGPSQAVEAAPSATFGTKPEEDRSTVRAMVTAVEGDTITVRLMGDGAGGRPMRGEADDGGAPPSDPPEGGAKPENLPEARKEGANEGAAPMPSPGQNADGIPPGQPGERPDEPGGETITLSAEISISLEKNAEISEGTAEDIALGSMIGITYGEDGQTVTGILVYQSGAERFGPSERQ